MKFRHYLKPITTMVALIGIVVFVSPANAKNSRIDRIVSFGASLSDTGNSFIWLSRPENKDCGTALNEPPYSALDSFLVPDGPYAIGGHQFTNGATWLEGFARYFAHANDARPAFKQGGKKASNYSVGGARAVTYTYCRFNLPAQLQAYFDDFRSTSPNTLFTLEIGGNDVRDAFSAAANGQNPEPILVNAIKSISDSLNALYSHGARKFLVLNVPDIGKTPAIRMIPIVGATALATKLTNSFNANLIPVLRTIDRLPGSKVKVLDIKGKLDEIVKHAEDYGFTNKTDACIKPNKSPYQCQTPDTYVFWDGIHPTQEMHEIVAQQAILAVSSSHK